MAKIHGNALVPVFDRDAYDRMAIVARGVVQQYADVAELGLHRFNCSTQLLYVADIAADEPRRRLGACEFLSKFVAGVLVDIHESDLRALAHKSLDDGGADPRPASGYENDLVLEAGVDGVTICHDFPLVMNREAPAKAGKTNAVISISREDQEKSNESSNAALFCISS